MRWIKIDHTDGVTFLNITQVFQFEASSTDEVTFYDANSILPTTFTFSSQNDRDEFLAKMSSILDVVNVDAMAVQTNA